MKRARRQPTRKELEAATSRRPVVRRIKPSSAANSLERKLDITATERAEAELNRFIENRALKNNAEHEQRVEDLFEETTRRYREKRREEYKLAWYCFHLDQAERLRRTMEALIAKHEAAAAALLEDQTRGAS